MLWPWPEPLLPGDREGSTEVLASLMSDFVQQPRRWQRCRQNIPPKCDFCAFVLKEMWPAASGQGHLQPAFSLGQLLHSLQKLGLGPGPCLLRKMERDSLRQGLTCIAPNHVLLLIDFGYSRISSYLFHMQFHKHSWRSVHGGHLVHILEAEWVPGSLVKILLSLQDCIVTLTYTVTDISQSSSCVTDLRSVGICKQGSQQDIFLPCIQ